MITMTHYLIFSALLFCISIAGIFINRKNILLLLMSIELMLLSVNTNFIIFSHFNNDINGQVFVFFILLGEAGGCKRIHPVPAEGSHSDKPNLTHSAAHTHTFHLLD